MSDTRTGRWRRVESLFERVADLPPDERLPILDAACGDDRELRGEVESLLASDPLAAEALRRVVAVGVASLTSASHVGARVGAYRLLDVIGEGGMGVVYLAERADAAYRARVAIKILRAGFVSTHLGARFRDERQILAALDHPNIVRMLDGGTTDDGLPYLVMEHVVGEPLAVHARTLSIRARVALVERIARTVQYAHQKLIVHRDLKPSNVMIARDGAPKLLDFGIAKLLGESPELPRAAETRTGLVMLTLDYASPEQARGEPVSVATDVYSLGGVLYDLLTGRPPQRAGVDALETLRILCEDDPPRPSVIAPAAVRRELAGDLDNIVARALQKRAADRYATVAAFADDLERYLTGLPIAAREASFAYRARKLIARRRGPIAFAVLVVGALAAATVLSIGEARRAVGEARRADTEARRAEQQARVLLFQEGRDELDRDHYTRALPYLVEALRRGDDSAATRVLIAAATRPVDRRRRTIAHPDGINSVAFSPDATRVVTAGPAGVRVFTSDGAPILELHGPAGYPSFSPDGARLAVAIGDMIELRDAATGAAIARVRPDGFDLVRRVAIAPDGRRVVIGTRGGDVGVCDVVAGTCIHLPGTNAVAVEPDGRLVTGDVDGRVRLLAPDGTREAELDLRHAGVATVVLLAPDRAFAVTTDGTVELIDLAARAPIATATEHRGSVGTSALSPDRARFATSDGEGTVLVWDARTGARIGALVGHAGGVKQIRWSADSSHLVTTGIDDTYRVWDVQTGRQELLLESDAASPRRGGNLSGSIDAGFAPDGSRVITASATELAWWDRDRTPLLDEIATSQHLYAASYAPDERRVLVAGFGGYVAIFDLARRAPLVDLRIADGIVYDAQWSPDGTRFVVAGEGGLARVYGAADGRLAFALNGHVGNVNRASFSPDGARIVTAGGDHSVRLWNAATGAELARLDAGAPAMAASWSRDGRRIVIATYDGTLWLVDDGLRRITTIPTPRQLLDASLSPSGTRIATAAHGGEIDVWDVTDRARVVSCEGHTGPATTVVWSPDGALLATSADDQTARVWDATTCERLLTLRHVGGTMQAMWSRDGLRLLVADNADRMAIWDVHRDARPLADLDQLLEGLPWRFADGALVRRR